MAKRKKRREIQKKRASREDVARQDHQLAYTGSKYKTEELVPVMFHAELGIHEADLTTQGAIDDHTVRAALQQLIRQIRRGKLAAVTDTQSAFQGDAEKLVLWSIGMRWRQLFRVNDPPSRDKLVGVLRTILGSIDVWGSMHAESRGYLDFIAGFVDKSGATVELTKADDELIAML